MVFFRRKKDEDAIKYRMTPKQVKAVVDEEGIIQVAACLPIDAVNKRFLLVTSATHPDAWVIPKGSWDVDETEKQAAMRETWEEAGVKGTIKRHIGIFAEKAKEGVRAHHSIYEMEIKQVAKKFPEQEIRQRRWFTYEDAMEAVKAHYVKDAISMSSLSPLVHPEEEGEKKKKKKKKKEEDDEGEEKKDLDDDEGEKKKKKKKKDVDEDEDDGEKKEKKKKKKDSDEEEDDGEKKEKKKKKKEELGEEVIADDENDKKKKKKDSKEEKKKNKESEITELTDEEIVKIQLGKLEVNPELEKNQ